MRSIGKSVYFLPLLWLIPVVVFIFCTPSCLVEEKCFRLEDCDQGRYCNADGECVYECTKDSDCGELFVCTNHQCTLDSAGLDSLECPDDMVAVENAFCIDIYEASRPDATADAEGEDDSMAVSKAGVIPWRLRDSAEAQEYCEAAGKILCNAAQWEFVCSGPQNYNYTYGNSYDPTICNGKEQFDGHFHLAPTGTFPDCTNGYGTFDMSGNLWEMISGGDTSTARGGAYNCPRQEYHRCDYIPGTWSPTAIGFRCCLNPEQEEGD